ncbi:MAG: DUF5063 domain-containing protein [Gammaproteobacteria bacterium]|nr:DUF5063 domain-containing protein [Gammaproteobacteria bacterium]
MTSLANALSEMVAVAEDFCQLIDSKLQLSDDSLDQLFTLMPRLHAAVTALNAYDTGEIPPNEVDLDERFEVYSRLRRMLGERDSYWLEFDAAPEAMHMSGSLADDLTDIYFDLRFGLELLDEVWPQRAAQAWQSTYRMHWGQHLVDAERHLYALKVRNQLVTG